MLVRDRFESTLSARLPAAYLLPRFPGSDSVVAQLRRHGVVVEQLAAALDARGERFTVDSLVRRPSSEGDSGLRLEGAWGATDHLLGEPGEYLVRAAQPLGVLAAVLLEPQSDDGFVTWSFFNAALESVMANPPGTSRVFPVARITAPLAVPTRIMP